MGRLFWKFFFAFLASLVVAGAGVGFTVSLFHDREMEALGLHEYGRPPPPPDWEGSHPPPREPREPREFRPPPPRHGQLPTLPLAAGLLAALVASALLAWYFSRPIRHLRWGLAEIAEGRFNTRVQQLMDGRHDELADLGRDVDNMAGKLDQLVMSQQRLLHDVSHELRSPLARIQAAIGLARQDASRTEATMDRIERETVRIDSLVGQLLTLARLDAGAGNEPLTEIDVVELLADIAQDANFEARAANREVRFECTTEFVMRGREEPLRRAFENVLRNAVKHTAWNTSVDIDAQTTDADRLHISVCDHGAGVPPSQLAAIFDPFHRAADAGQDGFGLGLAIARRAIGLHGGTISAENRPNGGLCIVIELPRT